MKLDGFEVEWWDYSLDHDFGNYVAVSQFETKRPAYLMRKDDYLLHWGLALCGLHKPLIYVYPPTRQLDLEPRSIDLDSTS